MQADRYIMNPGVIGSLRAVSKAAKVRRDIFDCVIHLNGWHANTYVGVPGRNSIAVGGQKQIGRYTARTGEEDNQNQA